MLARLFGAALGALCLASCSTVSNLKSAITTVAGVTVSQKTIAVAVQSFAAAELAAKDYISLPTCSASVPAPCKTAATTATVIADVEAGRAARDRLWSTSKADPSSVGAVGAYNAFIAATAALRSATPST